MLRAFKRSLFLLIKNLYFLPTRIIIHHNQLTKEKQSNEQTVSNI